MHHAVAAGVVPAAPAHPGPGAAPPSAQTHSQFHQRTGVLRPMARPAPAPPQGASRNRSAQQARSAAPPEDALLGMIADAEGGGAGDDERHYDGSDRDPLRREARLEAGERRPDGAGALALAHPDPAAANHDDAALQQLQQRLGGGAEVGGASAADDALALLERLAEGPAGGLADRVAQLRRSASADPSMHRPGADGVQVWIAQRQAASFNLLDACLQQGASLHARLSGNGLLAPGGAGHGLAPAERVGVALLEAGRNGSAAALATRVGALAGPGRDGRNASQLMAAGLRELPHDLWPTREARARLLHELDRAADDGSAPAAAEQRTERQLRTVHDHQENQHA